MLYLEKGEVLSKVGRLKKSETYGVRMRSVVAIVHGTQLWCNISIQQQR